MDDTGTRQWELGLGAVLYDVRYDAPENKRRLWHVTSRFTDFDSGQRLYELWDGTHTNRRYYLADDILADHCPAGWQWPVALKPAHELPVQRQERDFDDYFVES